ncbi:CcoQ/FixQ family Cbb3-type cytochrome c oxidase assembly chaperone [Halomonas halodenitrificans]|uniref:CcoQ/FixQ family Cbb3-type cytochrome c oxidase assembly chaperone n=1 Tax=Halomonas halodenitrificans TaxID=28252 RepID=UPI000486EA8B|nr:CcoQ/FixQ family Cbb3-type cytochrome c oxidase assembly chaperone [Halomonas halodenitrificans]
MDSGTVSGIVTGILILVFIGITVWAYSKRRKPDFDEAANLPFADDDPQQNRDTSASPDGADSRKSDSCKSKGDRNT